MKRIIFTLAAVATLSATPALAGLMDEVAQEKNAAAQIVTAPRITSDAATHPREGNGIPAAVEAVWFASYPEADLPADRGN